MRNRKFEKYYLRYLNGESLGEKEMTGLKKWMAKDEKDKNYLERLHKAAKAKTLSEQLNSVDVDENWTRFEQTITKKTLQGANYSFTRINRFTLYRIAAAIVLLITATAILYFSVTRPDYSIQQVSSANQVIEIKLSDGSLVLLNRNASLSYPEKLRKNRREVILSGEAYFDITRKKNAPFYVFTDKLAVKVLGTSFNIKETIEGNTVVSVITGEVAFFEKDNRKNIIHLSKGQRGIFNPNTDKFKQDTLGLTNTYFWDKNNLTFKDLPLAEVFDRLEIIFDKRFLISDQEILEEKLTAKCEGQELEEILDEFSILLNIQYHVAGDTIKIQKANE
jgi:ferric-dicitrate binding protein FerR (iron transport regulator)